MKTVVYGGRLQKEAAPEQPGQAHIYPRTAAFLPSSPTRVPMRVQTCINTLNGGKNPEMAKGTLLAAAMMAALTAPAHAADPTSLRDALSSLPIAAAGQAAAGGFSTDQEFPLAAVMSLSAARAIAPGDGDLPQNLMMRLMATGSSVRPFREWAVYNQGKLGKELDVPASKIDGFAAYGSSPEQQTSVWIMAGEADAATVFGGLPAHGFSPTDADLLINGEPGELNLKGRDPGNPWLGELGMTSTVGLEGRTLIQASTPEQVALVRSATPTLNVTAVPAVDTLLRGVEAVTTDGTRVVQAILSPMTIGVSAGDPAKIVLSKDGSAVPSIEDAQAAVEQQVKEDSATGLPPYMMVLIADIEQPGKRRGAAIAFAYSDCALAEQGASRFIARWKSVPMGFIGDGETMAQLAPADASRLIVPGADGGCAAVVTLTNAVPADTASYENNTLKLVIRAIMQRDFVAATIAPTANPQ